MLTKVISDFRSRKRLMNGVNIENRLKSCFVYFMDGLIKVDAGQKSNILRFFLSFNFCLRITLCSVN